MTGKEILEFNRLLATSSNWCRDHECRDVEGHRCDLDDVLGAHSFSLDGALLSVVGEDRLHEEALSLVMCLGPGPSVNPNNALTVLMDLNDETPMSWMNLKTRLMKLIATK